MKLKSIFTILMVTTLYSCGPKFNSNSSNVKSMQDAREEMATIKNHIKAIDSNNNLKEEITEGALTDQEGLNDIGSFKYTVYFDEESRELIRIKNVEITNESITENFYFKDDDLFCITVSRGENKYPQKLYLPNTGATVETVRELARLSKKAQLFKRNFKNKH